jgi:hypothetical protein
MGSTQHIDKRVIKSSSVSEKDVTIGLPKDKLDEYVDTIFPEEMKESFKKEIKKKIKVRLFGEKDKIISSSPISQDTYGVDQNIIGEDFYIFVFFFLNNKNDNTFDLAYQFITGTVEVAKAYNYKKFLFFEYGKKYEEIPVGYSNFLKENFNVSPDDIKQYLLEEKKFLPDN